MLTITTNRFENDVLHADKPVLVDFWAQWCPYCRRIAPAFDKVGEQYADTLIAGKINYDEEPQLIERFGIDTIPTLMLFKDGKALGALLHFFAQRKAVDAALEAGIVVDLLRQGHLPAGRELFQHQHRKPASGGVQGGGISGGAAADDDHVIDLLHSHALTVPAFPG